MTKALALIPLDLQRSALGLPSQASRVIGHRSVLAHTLARVSQVKGLAGIVLVHPQGQRSAIDALVSQSHDGLSLPVHHHEVAGDTLDDPFTAMRVVARKIAPASWRGGLGGVTCYDELLCAQAFLDALDAHQARSAVLVGPDWLLVDPGITAQVLALHLENPETMQMTFSQAAPGLAGIAIGRALLEQMAGKPVCMGHLLAYNPQRPQADPIGRDVCVQIPPAVRDCPHRLIADLPRSIHLIERLAARCGPDVFSQADAVTVAGMLATLDAQPSSHEEDGQAVLLPREVTLELTPRRPSAGPITPQHHVTLDRPDLSLDDALALVKQLGAQGDALLTLGGLGDALLHPQWEAIVLAAKQAGVWGIVLETDLQVDEPTLQKLLDLPVDILHVRLNADTTSTYHQMMVGGASMPAKESDDPFKRCVANLQWLLNTRNSRWQQPDAPANVRAGLPWIVPSLIKTAGTLRDMETFFDRWMVYTGHAVIAPPQTGGGLMPDQSLVPMNPPRRRPCRQLGRRLTVLSNGHLAQCDQDWLGRGEVGHVGAQPLSIMMARLQDLQEQHRQSRWDASPLCVACTEWHRP